MRWTLPQCLCGAAKNARRFSLPLLKQERCGSAWSSPGYAPRPISRGNSTSRRSAASGVLSFDLGGSVSQSEGEAVPSRPARARGGPAHSDSAAKRAAGQPWVAASETTSAGIPGGVVQASHVPFAWRVEW